MSTMAGHTRGKPSEQTTGTCGQENPAPPIIDAVSSVLFEVRKCVSRPLADRAATSALRIFCGKVSMCLSGSNMESRGEPGGSASVISVLIHTFMNILDAAG